MTHRRRGHTHTLRGSRHASLAEKPVQREEKVQVEVRKVDALHRPRIIAWSPCSWCAANGPLCHAEPNLSRGAPGVSALHPFGQSAAAMQRPSMRKRVNLSRRL